MLKDHAPTQTKMEFVTIDELVPSDHLLRKIDKKIDFGFIHDLVKDLYCADNGRPALDQPSYSSCFFLVIYLVYAVSGNSFEKCKSTSRIVGFSV